MMIENVVEALLSAESRPGLLVRPAMHPDEWHQAHFVRVALANGLPPGSASVMANVREATCRYSHRARTSHVRLHLQSVIKLAEPILGVTIPKWALRGGSGRSVLKVCRACVAAKGYFSARWTLRGFHLCLQHFTYLEELPTFAGTNVQMRRLLQAAGLPEGTSSHLPSMAAPSPQAIAVARELWSPTWLEEQANIPPWLGCAVLMAELLRGLITARRGRDGPAMGQEWERVTSWLQEHGMKVTASEQGIERFLEDLWVPIHRTAAYRLLNRVNQCEMVCQTVMSSLPLNRWIELLSSRAVRIFGKGAGGGVPDAARRPEVVLINTLASELGVSRKRVWSAMSFCRVEPVAVVGRNRKFKLIARKDVSRLEDHLLEYMGADEATASLHINGRHSITRTLRLAGVLKTIGAGPSTRYSRISVIGMLETFSRLAVHEYSVPFSHLLALDDSMVYHRRQWKVVKELYEDLLAGRIPLYSIDSGRGISAFAVPIDVLARLARRSLDFASKVRRDARQLDLQLC